MRHIDNWRTGEDEQEGHDWQGSEKEQPEIVIKSIFAPFLLPFKMMFLLMRLLFFAGGWGVVVTGYCAVVGSAIAGGTGMWAGFVNRGNGMGATMLAFGGGFFAFGMMMLFLIGAGAVASGFMRMASGRPRKIAPKMASLEEMIGIPAPKARRLTWTRFKLAYILLAAGVAAGGVGLLAGGLDQLVLPDLPFWQRDHVEFRYGPGDQR